MNRKSTLLFVLLAIIWGGSYTFIKISLGGLTPAQIVLGRLLFGAAFMHVVLRVRGVKLPPLGVWPHIAVTSILGMVLPFFLLAWGERHTSAALASVLIAATPLLTMGVVTAMLPNEKASWRKAGGLLIGFGGVALIVSPWAQAAGSLQGHLAVLCAAASYAAQTVYVRKYLSQRGIAPLSSSAAQVTIGLGLHLLVMPFFPWATPTLTAPVVISTAILGMIGTGLAYLIYFRLIGDLGPTSASAVTYLVPIAGMLFGFGLLDEPITWNMIAGTIVVLAGIAFAEKRTTLLTNLLKRVRRVFPSMSDATEGAAR
jgi:drug/metabolite transporter (DMT)-like permease